MAHAHVRPATTADAEHIARLQVSTWQVAYAKIVPASVLGASDAGIERVIAQWRRAITYPPSHAHRVLVAVDESPAGSWITGFAASGPPETTGDDPELEGLDHDSTLLVSALLVAPRWGRRGHGSRLLAATVDLAREAGLTQGVSWLLEGDKPSKRFFAAGGWEPDGVARVLDMEGTLVTEERYVTRF